MKTNQKTKRSISFWMVWGILGLILLAGCGGGGGGGGDDDLSENGHWDSMVWDQDDWR